MKRVGVDNLILLLTACLLFVWIVLTISCETRTKATTTPTGTHTLGYTTPLAAPLALPTSTSTTVDLEALYGYLDALPGPTTTTPPTTMYIPPVTQAAYMTACWDCLAQCESSGNWHTNTGNGYYGGLQIWPPTWEAFGGLEYSTLPHWATRQQQIIIAERILAAQGRQAWPGCTNIGAW